MGRVQAVGPVRLSRIPRSLQQSVNMYEYRVSGYAFVAILYEQY